MYFPYVRGRQYELLALRELATNNLLGDYVTPIIEPVKLSPTLVNVMAEFIKVKHPISIIRNPAVGTFMSDWQDVQEQSKEAGYKQRFSAQYEDSTIIKSLIMQRNAKSLLEFWDKHGVNKADLLVINTDRDYLDLYENAFGTTVPRYALMPDESVFRRKVRHHKVLLDDKFEKQDRNADYQETEDEFFSDDQCLFEFFASDILKKKIRINHRIIRCYFTHIRSQMIFTIFSNLRTFTKCSSIRKNNIIFVELTSWKCLRYFF